MTGKRRVDARWVDWIDLPAAAICEVINVVGEENAHGCRRKGDTGLRLSVYHSMFSVLVVSRSGVCCYRADDVDAATAALNGDILQHRRNKTPGLRELKRGSVLLVIRA